MTRAIIYVPSDGFEAHASRCMEYCKAQGYEFKGLIRGNWEAARGMALRGETTVVIVASEQHLDPQRKPRIEVVANQPGETRWENRTRIIRRNAAG